jgi:hypothetical protein
MTFEEIDPRVIDTMRKLRREAEDAEYEASTPGADRWRDRLAQRHRFGRALDLPPAEPRDGIERGIIWAAVVSVALWGIFALIWWLA